MVYIPQAPGLSSDPGKVARVSIIDGLETDVKSLSAALAAQGCGVFASSVAVDATFILSGLTHADAATRHWRALEAARNAKQTARRLIFLQRAAPASGLEGLSRTLRKEWPSPDVTCWTLPPLPQEEEASLIAHALSAGYGDGVLQPDGNILTPVTDETLSPAALPPQAPGIWLITGGARGVTAACAEALARETQGIILLAGRSAETPWPDDLPQTGDIKTLRGLLAQRARNAGERLAPAEIDRLARALLAGAEIRETLAKVAAAGAEVDYLPMDVADTESVRMSLGAAQARYGRITGWVHGAGVLADRLVDEKTESELRRVFAPKIGGYENILRVVEPAQLTHIAFFSSAAAFYGNRGQSDYAMANALLTNEAHELAASAPQARIKVFHWGPWAGGMVDASLASHFEAQGIPLIPVDEGARIFATELLAGDAAQLELVVGEAWAAS